MVLGRDEVFAAFDALDHAFDDILQLQDFTALSPADKVGLAARMERNLRRAPTVAHRLTANLTAEVEPRDLGAASWPDVLTTALRISKKDANRRLRAARSLGPRQAMTGQPLPPLWEATAAAQTDGLIGAEHLEVIEKFHKHLPGWVDADTRAAADTQLAELATGLGPEHLHKCADRLLAMIDQDGPAPSDEDHQRQRSLTLGPQQRDGMTRVTGWLTPAARATWEALLAKLAAPGACNPDDHNPRPDSDPPAEHTSADIRTQPQRNHDAFNAVGRSILASGKLGQHNGLPATIIVSTTLAELQSGAGLAVTGGGSLLPMREVIALAANAHHYLAVFDQHTNQALYLGRARRCATPAQRIMLHARDRGCTRPGCTTPGYQCQVHHADTDWKNGGTTNINNLTLACGPDNRLIENTDWTTHTRPDGTTAWTPPPNLDTGQTRTNDYHHPQRNLLPKDDPPEDNPPEDDPPEDDSGP